MQVKQKKIKQMKLLQTLLSRVNGVWLTSQRELLRLRSTLTGLFTEMPRHLSPRFENRRSHAGTVVDLFATIMSRVKGVGLEDMNSTLDIIRYNFPNVEHKWLIQRFEKTYLANYPLDATLTLAAAKRTEAERISLALEIFAMLHSVGGDLTNPQLFAMVCYGLNLPGMSQIIENMLSTPGARAERPMESLSFDSEIGKGNFILSPEDTGVRFRAVRCANLMLIINDGVTIQLRGRKLHKGEILPFTTGQSIELEAGTLTYKNMLFLMQAQYSGLKMVNYLQLDGDSITITRQRSLNSIARVRLGVHVEIEVLRKDADLVLENTPLLPNSSACTSYYTPFTLKGNGPYVFADITEHSALERSFMLDPTNRVILVTNMHSMNRPGALMLQPGLAPSSVFEVRYSSNSNTGELRILEGCSTMLVDGQPLRSDRVNLKDGDLISLSSTQALRCRFSVVVLDEESSTITTLDVEGLTRDFVRSGRVLDNIDFSLKRGELACILGPSGSGKSTLLRLLAGHLSPTMGVVQYNGETMSPEATNLRRHVAFIPREDILDEAMSVSEHMVQASIIRRPRLNRKDRYRRVQAVLNFLGMGHLSNRSVGRAGERTISDGERTRLNLGLDLTGTAEVFLIDEPISGLSSADAERVMQTIEGIAEDHILVCTLHRPAASLLKRFHKVMVIDSHGQMAYWGSPQQLERYFTEAARDMGLRIPAEIVHAGGSDYVFEVLQAPYTRLGGLARENTKIWQERYEAYAYRKERLARTKGQAQEPPPLKKQVPAQPARGFLELWRIFVLWCTRTFLGRVRSRMGLYALLLEGPVLALLIAGTLREATDTPYTFYKALHINEYLFLSLVLAMFFGLTDSACEILRDRPLLRRESNYKLFTSGYLGAKTLVLTGIASIQCALYLLVGNWILDIDSMFWWHWSVMSLTAFIGITLSLMVSSLVRSERTALNIVPLLLVPQILLAGAMIKFEDMNEFSPDIPLHYLPERVQNGLSQMRHRVAYQDSVTHDIMTKPIPLVAELCPMRYAFEMMFVLQGSENRWEKESSIVNECRNELREHGNEEELRFIQRAVMALNSSAADTKEAARRLRLIRKSALQKDEDLLNRVLAEQEAKRDTRDEQPLEFFYTNRKLVSVQEGVKTARKDARISESRGFYLAPRQPAPLSEMDQQSDEGSVSTTWRNAFYLFLMGLVPIIISAWRLKRIVRGK